MGQILENLADHAAAGVARADFDERSYPCGVGRADDARKVDRVQGLSFDRVCGRIAIRYVGSAPGAAVELEVRRWFRIEAVQLAVSLAHRAREIAMHGADALQRKPVAADRRDDLVDRCAITADHALIGGVHDKQIHALLPADRRAHGLGGAVDHSGDPFDVPAFRQLPKAAQHLRLAGEVMREQ